MHAPRIALLFCCTLLAACLGDKTGTEAAVGEDGLPTPATASGSVTGMPDPGVAGTRPAARPTQQPDIVELPEPIDSGAIALSDPANQPPPLEGPPVLPPEPTMPEDPNAPPPEPLETGSTTDPNTVRQ